MEKSIAFAAKAMELIDQALIAGRRAAVAGDLPLRFHATMHERFVALAEELMGRESFDRVLVRSNDGKSDWQTKPI